MPWLSAESATNTDEVTKYLPVNKPRAKNANASTASDSESENENSPAIVEAIFPP